MIVKIKSILLDTSHLSQISHDISSNKTEFNNRALRFLNALIDEGYFIFLTSHQILELLRHNEFSVRLSRMNFLKSLKMVSWIKNVNSPGAGSIIDLHTAEALAIINAKTVSIDELRSQVKKDFIKFGSGVEACELFSETWQDLHDINLAGAEHEREVIAISKSKFANIGSTKLSSWISGKIRGNESSDLALAELQVKLSEDVKSRGDKRILNKEEVAKKFIDLVRASKENWKFNTKNPALNYLYSIGIKPSDITDSVTMDEIGDLASFRTKLSILAKNLPDIDPEIVTSINARSMPSYLVDHALRVCAQDQSEWKGSELNDRYLASFAPFVEITCVDKRTHESFIQGSIKFSDLKSMQLNIQKAANYNDINLKS